MTHDQEVKENREMSLELIRLCNSIENNNAAAWAAEVSTSFLNFLQKKRG
tara:strand:+ start:12618 stop:12767 length:150 start_codon:yes stop_codon:yes gene_type:complete